jgi:hypothetical protein
VFISVIHISKETVFVLERGAVGPFKDLPYVQLKISTIGHFFPTFIDYTGTQNFSDFIKSRPNGMLNCPLILHECFSKSHCWDVIPPPHKEYILSVLEFLSLSPEAQSNAMVLFDAQENKFRFFFKIDNTRAATKFVMDAITCSAVVDTGDFSTFINLWLCLFAALSDLNLLEANGVTHIDLEEFVHERLTFLQSALNF